jgi:hypothetical protein
MQPQPPLHLRPRHPRFLIATTSVGCGLAAVMLCVSELPIAAAMASIFLLAAAAWQCARSLRRRIPSLLVIHHDGRFEAEFAGARRIEGTLAPARTIQDWLVTIRLQLPDGGIAVPLTADMLDAEDFRRLRVCLRWGAANPPELAEY